jgi:phenylacetic acid degradation operon negative regulatory protein
MLREFVWPGGGSVWASTLIRGLGACEISEASVRQVLVRQVQLDILGGEKVGRRTRWHLTAHGLKLLSDGSRRIHQFRAGDSEWDGRWLVVLCSVPEEERFKRYQLRTRLTFAGFGFLGPSVAISPHLDREETANTILRDLSLFATAVVLRAEAGQLVDDKELLHRAWDLETVAHGYDDFIEVYLRNEPQSDEACFRSVLDLVLAWQEFVWIDPEIPTRLLPDSWSGERAKALFDKCYEAWLPRAKRWFDQMEASAST